MTTDQQQVKHKRRKQAWEQLNTPRVSWEEFKRIEGRATSLEQAITIAKRIIKKKK